jgi:hypothetical protein
VTTPPKEPRPGPRRLRRDAYGGLLVVVLLTVAGMGLGGNFEPVTIFLQSAMLVFALYTADAPRPFRILATWFGAIGIIVSLVHTTYHDRALESVGSFIGMGLSVAAAGTILKRVARNPLITASTVYAVLAVYLLVGNAFAYFDQGIASATGTPFFTGRTTVAPFDYLYFSFITISTVGYGDFTPATRIGQVLAATEAVIGQLYLVSVVGLVVGNFGRLRTPRE